MSELYIQNVIRSLKQLEIAKEKIDQEFQTKLCRIVLFLYERYKKH